jgi:hypothetical protein
LKCLVHQSCVMLYDCVVMTHSWNSLVLCPSHLEGFFVVIG